jgi:hypothetical protein
MIDSPKTPLTSKTPKSFSASIYPERPEKSGFLLYIL